MVLCPHKQIVHRMQHGVLRSIPISLGVGPFLRVMLIRVKHFLHMLSNGGETAFQLGLVSFATEYVLGVT